MKILTTIGILAAAFIVSACDKTESAATSETKPNIIIQNWGPQTGNTKKTFNVQPNGQSAIWFEMKGAVQPQDMEAYFGDKKIDGLTIQSEKGGALLVPEGLLVKPGKYPVYLMHTPSKTRIDIGPFEVRPSLNDIPTIKVSNWGPKSTSVGQVFNKQPDGLSAIWFEMAGEVVSESIEARFGDQKISSFAIASNKGGALVIQPNLLGKAGEYPVYLIHTPSNTRFDIGQFTINK